MIVLVKFRKWKKARILLGWVYHDM